MAAGCTFVALGDSLSVSRTSVKSNSAAEVQLLVVNIFSLSLPDKNPLGSRNAPRSGQRKHSFAASTSRRVLISSQGRMEGLTKSKLLSCHFPFLVSRRNYPNVTSEDFSVGRFKKKKRLSSLAGRKLVFLRPSGCAFDSAYLS